MTLKLSSIKHILFKKTYLFEIKLWAAIVTCIVLVLLLLLILTIVFIYCRFRKRSRNSSKDLEKVDSNCFSMDRRLLSRKKWDLQMINQAPEKQVMYLDDLLNNEEISGGDDDTNIVANVEFLGRLMLKEIEAVTNGLDYENVIGSGEYGEVYFGFLKDNKTQVAVKNLFSNRCSEETFVREAEAMMLIRHKNLVKLQGYCAEGTYRMLVHEYVDNGNLEYWLHKIKSRDSPLTWNIRMKIIIGIAKGLAYLHKDTEPRIVHRNIKSSNILLDQQWNPKISQVGIHNFLGPEWDRYPPTGMSGYIAPEYSPIHPLDKKSDVYSFGILIMEIVSGKTATFESTEHLVDWIKYMVTEENFGVIIDPKLPGLPSMKELKRVLLIALRCVDCEVKKRPKIGNIIHMLEPLDLLLSDVRIPNLFRRRSLQLMRFN